jgi:RNA recognition motif-containing protein
MNDTEGQFDYRHETGEISKVKIERAGMGIRTVRIANLPPEVSDRTMKNILSQYGEVKEVKEERWSKSYRYKIANGIRLVTMNLRSHIPSYLTIANNKVLLSYQGQPMTCCGCGITGHFNQECSARFNRVRRTTPPTPTTWSTIVQQQNTLSTVTEVDALQPGLQDNVPATEESSNDVCMRGDTEEEGLSE